MQFGLTFSISQYRDLGEAAPLDLYVADFDDGTFSLIADFDDVAGADVIWEDG